MTIHTAPLNLLTFPQRWDPVAGEVVVRVLCLPVGDPRDALAPGPTAFANADLRFEAFLVGSLDHVPRAVDAVGSGLLALLQPPLRKAELFDTLAGLFDIKPGLAVLPVGQAMSFRKPVTDSYRALAGMRQLGDELISAHDHECALHEAHAGQPAKPVLLKASLRWGQVIAYALRQPALATALGLMGEVRVPVAADFYRRGGWLWLAPDASGDLAGDPALLALYAARIPPLVANVPRAIYAPVLFPVDRADFKLDEVLHDAERYDDGFARMVHGAQGDAPDAAGGGVPRASGGEVRDAVRLAWDDEQVARWFTRQVSAETGAPMGTAGFRVDVRESGGAGDWVSLQRLQSIGNLVVGNIDLGAFSGEGMVEVVPAQISPARPGEFWMPAYFTAWRGASLVLTDTAMARLAQPLPGEAAPDARFASLQLNREERFAALDDKRVALRYGQRYDFRVRLVDLTCGGPPATEPTPEAPDGDAHLVSTVAFRRHRRPGPVLVLQRPDRALATLVIEKPRLGFPEILYTRGEGVDEDSVIDALRAARRDDAAAGLPREPGLPDPDVIAVAIVLEARALNGDGDTWQALYRTERSFDTPVLELPLRFEDHASLATFVPAALADGPLPLPTSRDLRLTLTSLGRPDANYFASDAARTGAMASVEVHIAAASEPALLTPREEPLLGFFLRTPPDDGSSPPAVQRLAQELGLQHQGLALSGRAGRRTLFAASAALRHTLSPEGSNITLSSEADVAQRWILALRLRIARDWTWRGGADPVITIRRRVARGDGAVGDAETVGSFRLPQAVAPTANVGLAPGNARDDGRQFTDLVFFDALDPKPRPLPRPEDGEFPAELSLIYEIQPAFASALVAAPAPEALATLRLPVTTPPSQVPRLMSTGLALSPYVAADDYSSTDNRRRMLWLEFDKAVVDPQDAYFLRVLARAPDPLLTDEIIAETRPEPPLPIDAEWMRLVRPGQASDDNGVHAMSGVAQGATGGRHFLVPLPDGLSESASELFDMLTCEIRVGHDAGRWCTAQGRYGPALSVSGMQHPAPPLACQPARLAEGIRVRAPLATPLAQGRHVRALPPKTRLWALLYARVQQADGAAWRNVLLRRCPLMPPAPDVINAVLIRPAPSMQPALQYAEGLFPLDDVHASLRLFGLADESPLTAMAVEFFTAPEVPDPLGTDLGKARMLRASPLVPVPNAC